MMSVINTPTAVRDGLYLRVAHFYARQMKLLDDGDAEGWAATFTEDGSFATNAYPEHQTVGRTALTAAVRRTRAELTSLGVVHRHWLGMLNVNGQDDGTVSARCYALVIAIPRGGQPTIHRSTTCQDVLVPHGDGYLVRSRLITRDDLA